MEGGETEEYKDVGYPKRDLSLLRDMESIKDQSEAEETAAAIDDKGREGKRMTTTIGMGTSERTSKKKGEEEAAAEATRADWRRTAATTAWPRSQPRRRDLPTWNITLWSSRHGTDVSAGT